jgi:cytochrome c oxidase assembly factor CtaG
MGATFGLAVGLSRTPTPASSVVDTTPAYERLGFDLPPAPDLDRLVGGLTHDGFALVLLEVAALAYALGVRALQARGEHWPGSRTLAWYAGVVVAAWATVGGLGLYAHVLFSLHVVAQMLLSVVAPVLLVRGAPLTLAQRTLPGRRTPRERGPRQLLQLVLDSRTTRVLGHPVVAGGLFVSTLYVLYLTPLFDALMAQHLGHSLMQLWFLGAGCLLFWRVIGMDSSARRWSTTTQAVVLLGVALLEAGFTLFLLRSHHLLARDYYEDLHRPYATNLLADQQHGAYVTWVLGVLPVLLVLGALSRRWGRGPGIDPLIASDSQVI